MNAVDAQVTPWTLISLDNFEFRGMFYLMLLDVATKFVIARPVQSHTHLNIYFQ